MNNETSDGGATVPCISLLAPFIAVARGIPDNWPGHCILRFDQHADGSLYMGYYGENDASGGITIDQWRDLAGANAKHQFLSEAKQTGCPCWAFRNQGERP